jgi:hypothetical protein
MKPISPPFQIDGEKTLTGIDARNMNLFFKQVFEWCKLGKIYQLKPYEVTASEVQLNYAMLCLSLIADEMGVDTESIKAFFEDLVFECATNIEDDFFSSETWLTSIVDIETGELKKQKLKSMRVWTTGMFNDFLDFVKSWYIRKNPKFLFPDPKMYQLPVKGRKRELPNSEQKLVFNFR